MLSVSPTNQDLSNDTTFSQIKSRVPVPLSPAFFVNFIAGDSSAYLPQY